MATYYVRPDGNNTNVGTGYLASQAWATITKAAQTMVAGDTVYIAPGTYYEMVTPLSGTVTFHGDPRCEFFPDFIHGAVIISGRNGYALSRPYGIDSTYEITVRNIEIREARTGAVRVLSASFNAYDCRFYGFSQCVSVGGSLLAVGCIFECLYNYAIMVGSVTGTAALTRCVIKNARGLPFPEASGATSQFDVVHCVVEGVPSISDISDDLNKYRFYGCIISVPGTHNWLYWEKNIIAYGTVFRRTPVIANSSIVNMQLLGCKFEDMVTAITTNGATGVNIQACVFKDLGGYAVNAPSPAITLNHCKFVSMSSDTVYYSGTAPTYNYCTFDGTGSQIGTHNGTTYATDGKTDGIYCVTENNPISGEKSLLLGGWGYTPPYIQWIPCEAGKPKTVSFKMKRNTANASYLPTAHFGDQSVTATNTTDVQTLSMTYTHYKTELVPLWICGRVDTTGTDFFLVDDIKA